MDFAEFIKNTDPQAADAAKDAQEQLQAAPAPAQVAPSPPTQAPAPANAYAGMGDAEVFGKRNRRVMDYLGVFEGEIVEIRDGVAVYTRAGTPYFAATLSITETSNTEVSTGTVLDWSTMPSERWPKYFLSNIKLFLSAVWGCEPEKVDEIVVKGSLDERQPARGRKVRWETFSDQKTGKVRTRFYPAT